MAIKLKSLERLSKTYTEQKYLYKDLALDLAQKIVNTPGFLTSSVPGNDIKESFDKAALRNSLQNLFNTLPGQRFLFPEYGLDLYQFLFLPVTESTGEAIGRRILQGVERFEPRVVVQRVNVQPRPDENMYFITLILQIPAFKQLTTLQGELNIKSQSFIFLPTSRNR